MTPEELELIKQWSVKDDQKIQDRLKYRIECYENYCYLNNIPMEMSWKVNLRKQITYNNKKYLK